MAYEQSGTAQRPYLQQTVTIATNTTYVLSVYVEAVTGTIPLANLLAVTSLPAGATATEDSLGNLAAGQRRTIVIAGTYTGGAIAIRAGLGTSSNATGTVRFSQPQLEIGSTPSPFVVTTSATAGALRRGNRGVLIEGARTNLQTRSNELTNGVWTPISLSVATSSVFAPDATATLFALTATVAGNRLQTDVTVVTATTHTVTYYVAQGTGRYAGIVVSVGGSAGAIYDLQTGVVVSTAGTLVGTSIQSGPTINGTKLWRISLTITSTGTTLRHGVGVSDGSTYTSTVFPSASSGVIYAGFAQLEAASFPSSYIPATTASATRAADVLTCTAGVSYPASLWAQFERNADAGVVQHIATLYNPVVTGSMMYVSAADAIAFQTLGTTGGICSGATVNTETVYKAAMRVLVDDVRGAMNGTLTSADVTASYPTAPTIIRFGENSDFGHQPLFGYIRRAAIFNSALSDANLQSVTT